MGYIPNAIKTDLVVKPALLEEAFKIYADTDEKIITQGQSYVYTCVGTAIGTSCFVVDYVTHKVENGGKR